MADVYVAALDPVTCPGVLPADEGPAQPVQTARR